MKPNPLRKPRHPAAAASAFLGMPLALAADGGGMSESFPGVFFYKLVRDHPLGATVVVFLLLGMAVGAMLWVVARIRRETREVAEEGKARFRKLRELHLNLDRISRNRRDAAPPDDRGNRRAG